MPQCLPAHAHMPQFLEHNMLCLVKYAVHSCMGKCRCREALTFTQVQGCTANKLYGCKAPHPHGSQAYFMPNYVNMHVGIGLNPHVIMPLVAPYWARTTCSWAYLHHHLCQPDHGDPCCCAPSSITFLGHILEHLHYIG